MKADIAQIGANKSIQEQKADIIKSLKGEKLLEKQFEKKMTEEELHLLAEKNNERGVKELFNPQGISLKTELSPEETVLFSQLMFMGNRYNIGGIDDFANNLLQFKVSLMRKGRREFIQGLHAEERRDAGKDLSPFQALMSKIGLQ